MSSSIALSPPGTSIYNFELTSSAQIDPLLQSGKAQFVLVIPYNFTKDLMLGRTAQIQTLYDATDANTARVIAGYADAIVQTYGGEIVVERWQRMRAPLRCRASPGCMPPRVWYNPDLESVNFLIPGLMTTILLFVTTTLTSTAIVKEKELGTLEQLIVTPIMPLELMIGKTVPFLLIGLTELTMTLADRHLLVSRPAGPAVFRCSSSLKASSSSIPRSGWAR